MNRLKVFAAALSMLAAAAPALLADNGITGNSAPAKPDAATALTETPDLGTFAAMAGYATASAKSEGGFWAGCFLSAGFGGQVYFGDHDSQTDFGSRIAPALDVAAGKWITPGFGLRIAYSGLSAKGATKHPGNFESLDSAHGTGKDIDGGGAPHYLEEAKFCLMNLHLDAMFDASQLLFGKDEYCLYHPTPYVGIGWGHVYDSPKTNALTLNAGLLNSLRIGDAFSINLDIRAMYVDDKFDGEEGGRSGEGMLTTAIGLTWHIK